MYYLGFSFILTNKFKDKELLSNILAKYKKELGDYVYMTWLISRYSALDLYTITTYFQKLINKYRL